MISRPIESERGVLGVTIVWGELARSLVDAIEPEMFYEARHRTVFEAIREIVKSGGAVDIASVPQTLRASGKLDEIGGVALISELTRNAIQQEHLPYHLAEIKRASYAERIVKTAQRMIDNPSDELVAEVQALAVARASENAERVFDVGRDLPGYLDSLEKPRAGDTTIDTGFRELDRLIGGLRRGDLMTVSARPGGGKTAFLVQTGFALADKGLKVMIFSTEMSAHQLMNRIMPSRAGVEAWRFRREAINADHRKKVSDACAAIHGKTKLWIIDKPRPSLQDVRAAVAKYKPDVLILDYLQRFEKPKAENVTRQVDAFMTELKTICAESHCLGLLGCQMNRTVDHAGGGPKLSDLRDGGAIESESDSVLLLSRDEKASDMTYLEIVGLLEKNRHGTTGAVRFRLNKDFMRMEGPGSQYEPAKGKVPSHGLNRKEALALNAYVEESE